MEQVALLKQTRAPIREGSPTIFLRGENLEYYRNIEYLKEVTRQANALLDRSNAKYENILDDQKLGYRVRARSLSDSTKSISPETEGKCRKCGLSHGAADFCIVEKIMDNERQIEDNKRKSKVSGKASWKSFMSISVDSKSLKQQPDLTFDETTTKKDQHKHAWENINILERMTSSQALDKYEMLCARYGANAARKFLQANSIANPPERKIEQWTIQSEDHPKRIPELTNKPRTHYKDISKLCMKAEPQEFEPLCPDISQDVREKMQQQVHLIPPCEGQPPDNRNKNWRAVFYKPPPEQDASPSIGEVWNDTTDLNSSYNDEPCKCEIQQCTCGIEKICTTPKVEKKCSMNSYEVDYDNNYLLTMRKKLWKRRETKRTETLHALYSKQNETPLVKTRRESEEYLRKAGLEQYNSLKNCLREHLKIDKYDQQEFNNNVQSLADISSPSTAINPRQLDHWLEQMKVQENIEEQDEIDSLPSDIQTEGSKSSISHSTGVDYNAGRIKPTRIPYADDVYDLIDNLYDKITRKFETAILKNSFKISRLSIRPTYAFLYRRMTLQSCQSPLFHDIMNRAKLPSYPKRLTPCRVRKLRKMKRLKSLQRRQVRTERRRVMTRGLMLGKQYRKVSRSYKYAPESGYIGFKPQERKMLDPNEPDRFAKFNLVEDPLRKAITTKTIHHDFRLMRSMFDDASKVNREDLMDKAMLDRLYEFQKKMYNVQLPYPPLTDSDTENEGYSDITHQIPQRGEMQLLQKAKSKLHDNLPRQMSYETVHPREPVTHTKAEKSNSADKLKNSEELSRATVRKNKSNKHGALHKCRSSTNVKGEKSKCNEPPQQSTVDKVNTPFTRAFQMRSSVKSLTNLLPPLKGTIAKSAEDNEFEESISSLQNELSSLLTQQSHRRRTVAPLNMDEANKTKPIPKKRNSGLSKLPELKMATRKTCSKTSMSKISDESLPRIKQRESVENFKPVRLQEKLPMKGLARKTSMLNLQPDNFHSLTNGKLPLLAENRKLVFNTSNESLYKDRRKSTSKRRKSMVQSIPKQSGLKAWR